MEVTLHGFRTDRKKKMDCKQVQSGIIDFINDNMDIKEMEQFISHIESCEELSLIHILTLPTNREV